MESSGWGGRRRWLGRRRAVGFARGKRADGRRARRGQRRGQARRLRVCQQGYWGSRLWSRRTLTSCGGTEPDHETERRRRALWACQRLVAPIALWPENGVGVTSGGNCFARAPTAGAKTNR